MKLISFFVLLNSTIGLSQIVPIKIYSTQLSECNTEEISGVDGTNLIRFSENDTMFRLEFISNANCGGIHDLKVLLENDTVKIVWQEGGNGETGIDSLWATEEGVYPLDMVDTTKIKGELFLMSYKGGYNIMDCDCKYKFTIDFCLLESKKKYHVRIRNELFEIKTKKRRKH